MDPVKVAIPHLGVHLAPCFEYCAAIRIYTIRRRKIVDRSDFQLRSRDPMDRIRLLRDQGVETLICGGVQDRFEDVLDAMGIQVFSWVDGKVTTLIESYLRGEVVGRRSPRQPLRAIENGYVPPRTMRPRRALGGC